MLRFKHLLQKHLDMTLKVNGGLTVRIVERPGMSLAPSECQALVADMRRVAATSVRHGELNYGVFDPTGERLRYSVITIVYDDQRVAIAFNALALLDVAVRGQHETVIHLGLVLIDPSNRSKGLSWILYGLTCIVLFLRNQLRPLWISNVTQVPAVVGMVSETFTNVYPSPDPRSRRSFTHLQIAREIMAHHRHVFGVGDDARFNEDRHVIENSYTGGSDNLKKTFDEVAKHRKDAYNAMCASGLDYERGDDFLQIAQINTQVIGNYLVKDVPRQSIFQVAGWFGVTMLNAFLMPMWHWFSTDRQYGALRVRGKPDEDVVMAIGEASTPKLVVKIPAAAPVKKPEPAPLPVNAANWSATFDYKTMTTRNAGFVNAEEQEAIRTTKVFVCGVGGMGGACLQALVRAGMQQITIADMDVFEVSNLNRQVFASMPDVGGGKVEVTRRKVLEINPNVTLTCHGPDWVDKLDQILIDHKIVVNGMDDIPAGIHLYRKAKQYGATVIDAYAAPLPSVTVVSPDAPRPESRLDYRTEPFDWRQLDKKHTDHCKFQEMLFVSVNSTSIKHFDMAVAMEMFQGKRSRPSFAPMVITTGNMMAFEALRLVMGRPPQTDCEGYFYNPWTCKVEMPRRGWSRKAVEWYARRELDKMLSAGGAS